MLETHKALMDGGFTPENAFTVIRKHPYVVRYQPQQLLQTLEMWRGCQFSNNQFIELMVQCPELLEFTDANQLERRSSEILSFAQTPKNLWRLLMASPNILTDNIQMIYAKADYLLDVMDVDITDMVKSGVFASSLEKIKCRHLLLVRLGFYKPRPKDQNPLDPNKNLRIARIMDTPDDEFARRICQISMSEVRAFNAYCTRELEEAKDDAEEEVDCDTSDGEDYEESDNEFDPRAEKGTYDPRHKNRYNKYLMAKKPKTRK